MSRLRTRRPRPPGDVGAAAWRLGLQIGLLFLACLLVVTGILVVIVVRSQQQQAGALLESAIAMSHGDGGRGDRDRDGASAPGSIIVAVQDRGGLQVDSGMPAGLPDHETMDLVARTGTTHQQTVTVAGRRYLVRTAKHGDDTVQAVLDLGEQSEELSRLLKAVAVAGTAGLLLSVAVSAWLARRAVHPIADALALQRRFVADASHELRTPLTLLSTRAQLLARRLRRSQAADAATQADVDGLVADAANLTEILDELLTAADAGSATDLGPVDVAALVRDIVNAGRAYAQERGITLHERTTGAAEIPSASRAGLLRAITALLDNAISHARTTVVTSVTTHRHEIVVEVADDGPGIAPEVAPTMFERFASRRAPAAPGERRHYGLGLALVAEVADRHGGSVAATNRTEGGAVLTMRLRR
ncbi:MAG TPA: HAMP domain-containing sensor histidine kinase [Microlunatus sp.]|nr:HAMP domain-containing sensor histidine kinase [Microlunatus sp.]